MPQIVTAVQPMTMDETRAPATHAQASDPGWSNYRWNAGVDVVSDMCSAPSIARGYARLSIMLAGTATAQPDPVPKWMKNKGLAYKDNSGSWHVRQDLKEGWRYLADFYTAFVRKYSSMPRIAQIIMGEYFPGEGLPSDFDMAAYKGNVKNIWAQVVEAAPLDANGNRINIVQVNPMTYGDGGRVPC